MRNFYSVSDDGQRIEKMSGAALALIAFLAGEYPDATAAEVFDALCDGEALENFASRGADVSADCVELAADMMEGPDGEALLARYRE